MKPRFLFARLPGVSLSIVAATLGYSQVVWNFGTSTGDASPSSNSLTNVTVSTVTQFNNNGSTTMLSSLSPSTGYTGASGQFNATASANPGTSLNPSTATAFQFTITPDAGYQFTLTGITFGTRSSATGPTLVAVRTSADNYSTDLLSGSSPNSSWSLISPSSFSSITATSALTVRIYGYGNSSGSAGSANWRLDDVTMSGSVSAIPEPSTYAAIGGGVAFAAALWRRRRRIR